MLAPLFSHPSEAKTSSIFCNVGPILGLALLRCRMNPFKAPAVAPANKKKKHIIFSRDGPRVTLVRAPPQDERSQLWFTESEKVVSKPLSFTVPAHEKVSISISMSVQLMSIVVCASDAVTKTAAAAGSSRVTLLVAQNNDGAITDSLSDRLLELVGADGGKPKRGSKSATTEKHRWFSIGSADLDAGVRKVNVPLPSGDYVLKTVGDHDITVFGQAVDLERHLE